MADGTGKPYKPHFSHEPDQLGIQQAIVLDELSNAYLERFGPYRYNELCERAIAEALASDPDPETEAWTDGVTVSHVKSHLLWPMVEGALRRELESSAAAPAAPAASGHPPSSTTRRSRWLPAWFARRRQG